MRWAIGISVHTGWGACVVASGSLRAPDIRASRVVEVATGEQRFCFHRAAQWEITRAPDWLAACRREALTRARREMAPLLAQVSVCAIVAKAGDQPDLASIFASHLKIHSAEGRFYRDVFREACALPCRLVAPASLDVAAIGRVNAKPWGRDQKLAAMAALQALADPPC